MEPETIQNSFQNVVFSKPLPKPLFGAKNNFWRQKCILARENGKWAPKRKKWKKGAQNTKETNCLEQGLRKGADMTQKGSPKRENALLRPKPPFALKVAS